MKAGNEPESKRLSKDEEPPSENQSFGQLEIEPKTVELRLKLSGYSEMLQGGIQEAAQTLEQVPAWEALESLRTGLRSKLGAARSWRSDREEGAKTFADIKEEVC